MPPEKTLNLYGKSSSMTHIEMWGESLDGEKVYIRYRAGTLEIRLSDSWSKKSGQDRYISENDSHHSVKKSLDYGPYAELKREFESWSEVLEGTIYSVNPSEFDTQL